jgi:muramidase (phage lysozyme)
MPRSTTLPVNLAAFLDMLAWSEIGPQLLAESDDGYNVLVGSTPGKPLLFSSYGTHPDIYNQAEDSTAAGRYQLIHRWWPDYQKLLRLLDFGPLAQDMIAVQQIRERVALTDIAGGHLRSAIQKCSNIWASLPGNNYGQHQQKLLGLANAFTAAGGVLAAGELDAIKTP